MTGDSDIEALREALCASPENVPLRRLLAETLLGNGRAELAEAEFRDAITRAPDDPGLKVGLASAFAQQGKNTMALVILEDVTKRPDAPAKAFVTYARLLFRVGDVEDAVRHYRRAVEADPTAADTELADRLGIRFAPGSGLEDTEFGEPDEDNDDDVVDGRVRSAWDARDPSSSGIEVERPSIKFEDVGGMETLKDEIRIKIILPMDHPDLFKAYGKTAGGGVLLYGPPGCGKTHLARATAGEIKAGFLSVGLNDVLEMWLGNSERNLHALFEQARTHTPCVLFFDEVDALAANRTDLRASGGRQVINQFLSELDGIDARNDGVLILAATNAPWHLDPAFRRPGRFDRILFVPPPDAAARASILRILCKGKPVKEIDFDGLAKKTDKFSGADLKAVVDVAIEAKLREALKAGSLKPLTNRDLLAATATVKPSTREWFSTARNYALYSNQDGTYDDILTYMKLT